MAEFRDGRGTGDGAVVRAEEGLRLELETGLGIGMVLACVWRSG